MYVAFQLLKTACSSELVESGLYPLSYQLLLSALSGGGHISTDK